MSNHSIEKRTQAVRWKLGLPSAEKDEDNRLVWESLRNSPDFNNVLSRIVNSLCQPIANSIRLKLNESIESKYDWGHDLADVMMKYVIANASQLLQKYSGLIQSSFVVITKKPGGSLPPLSKSPLLPPPLPPSQSALHPDAKQPSSPLPNTPATNGVNLNIPAMPSPPPLPPAKWKYKPIESAVEPHTESECRTMENSPAGWATFGARVRGRKHKLDGTNCDDSFDFRQVGEWTILAVSDGAGSKKYSRIGAKAATREAVAALAESVTGPELSDAKTIRNAIIAAMQRARTAISIEAASRATQPEFVTEMGRPLDDQDFSCTLLVAMACNTVEGLQMIYFSQVGDGMIGAIDRQGNAHVLGVADSGGHAGETEFITSEGKSSTEFLLTKTSFITLDLQALLVMSDGVADDYFPGAAELPRLWTDVLVNGIADVDGEASPAIGGTTVETIAEKPFTFTIHSSASIVTPPADLIRSPRLIPRTSLPGDNPHDRLRLWIDAYQVRGSFDDRTLVLHHRRELP